MVCPLPSALGEATIDQPELAPVAKPIAASKNATKIKPLATRMRPLRRPPGRVELLDIFLVVRFHRAIRFHGVRHPQEMGAEEVKAFLSHLATKMNVAASTQNQAFSALLFFSSAGLVRTNNPLSRPE
jgi:hypothetical protein